MEKKELRAKNYARVIDEHDNPFLVIFFGHDVPHTLNFLVRWYNPKGRLVKSYYWSLKKAFYYYDQFIVEYLDYGKPLDVGEWFITITAYEQILEPNVYKEEDILVRFRFLVLPFDHAKQILDNDFMQILDKHQQLSIMLERSEFYNYWLVDSICTKENIYLTKGSSVKTCRSSYWSTYYPDPKSDLLSSLTLELNQREKI